MFILNEAPDLGAMLKFLGTYPPFRIAGNSPYRLHKPRKGYRPRGTLNAKATAKRREKDQGPLKMRSSVNHGFEQLLSIVKIAG